MGRKRKGGVGRERKGREKEAGERGGETIHRIITWPESAFAAHNYATDIMICTFNQWYGLVWGSH